MKVDTAGGLVDDALRYASQETRSRMADALAALLQDAAKRLEGNQPEGDTEWFARMLASSALNSSGHSKHAPDWQWVARIVLDALPHYQMRVASRAMHMARFVAEIAAVERKAMRATAKGTPAPTPKTEGDDIPF